jgi:hypothetical protein
MSDYLNTVESLFSIDHLPREAARTPEGMASLLICTYMINAKAISRGQELIHSQTDRKDEITAGYQQVDTLARSNLAVVAQLLGERTITCYASYSAPGQRPDMQNLGRNSVTGFPNVKAANPRFVLAPPRKTGYLRLVDTASEREDPRGGLWWDINMADRAGNPLVKVEVHGGLGIGLQGGKFQR